MSTTSGVHGGAVTRISLEDDFSIVACVSVIPWGDVPVGEDALPTGLGERTFEDVPSSSR